MLDVELADPRATPGLFEGELVRELLCELDDVQPRDGGFFSCIAGTRTRTTSTTAGGRRGRPDDARRPVEEPFEALDEDGAERTGTQVAGDGLVAVQHAVVLAYPAEDGGQGVIRGDEREGVGVLASKVVDLEVLVRELVLLVLLVLSVRLLVRLVRLVRVRVRGLGLFGRVVGGAAAARRARAFGVHHPLATVSCECLCSCRIRRSRDEVR